MNAQASDQRIPTTRMRHTAWWLAALGGFAGIVLAFGLDTGLGDLLFAVAALVLAAMAMRSTGVLGHGPSLILAIAGLGAVTVVALVQASGIPLTVDVLGPVAGTGAQLLLLALSHGWRRQRWGWGRTSIPIAGHLTVLAASSLLVAQGLSSTVILFYAGGFALLLLETFWVHRALRSGRESVAAWEGSFLVALSVALAIIAIQLVLRGPEASLGRRALPGAVPVLYVSVLFGVALLAGPPRVPHRFRPVTGSASEVVVNSVSLVALLTLLVLVVYVATPILIGPLFLVLTGWLVVVVTFEYLTTIYGVLAWRSEDPEEPDVGDPDPITVVIAARNEAELLEGTVERNLEIPLPLSFLLVPSVGSADDTVEVAEDLARRHPDRVRVHLGTGRSKAEDLNQAWPEIETDTVLLLDADETTDARSLRRGLEILDREPEVGIVQGRKKSHKPGYRWLHRLIAVERRFSTLFDHQFQANVFGAGHFAGSGALMRREVPPSVGGFDDGTLTEDIELTVRVYLRSEHRIAYEPRMLVREHDPGDLAALVRQRGRWARGWAEVHNRYLFEVATSGPRIGWGRALGLSYQLTTAVSAPWVLLLPAVMVLWWLAGSPLLPPALATALAIYILPARLFTFPLAYLLDPTEGERFGVGRLLEIWVHAYTWILLGWFFQLHALYLEVSDAPRTWHATRRSSQPAT